MKLTKIEVGFEHPAKGEDHCRDCIHWQAPNRCKIVQGVVMGIDWCKKYEDKSESRRRLPSSPR